MAFQVRFISKLPGGPHLSLFSGAILVYWSSEMWCMKGFTENHDIPGGKVHPETKKTAETFHLKRSQKEKEKTSTKKRSLVLGF